MIAEENEHGDLDLKITAGLFDLVADYLGNDDRASICFLIERLPVRTAVRLERLSTEWPEKAEEMLRAALTKQALTSHSRT